MKDGIDDNRLVPSVRRKPRKENVEPKLDESRQLRMGTNADYAGCLAHRPQRNGESPPQVQAHGSRTSCSERRIALGFFSVNYALNHSQLEHVVLLDPKSGRMRDVSRSALYVDVTRRVSSLARASHPLLARYCPKDLLRAEFVRLVQV